MTNRRSRVSRPSGAADAAQEPVAWGELYDQNVSAYRSLRQEVDFILEAALQDAGIKTHSVTSRVKTRESFLEKVDRKTYVDPFAETPDLVGARVVCLFLEDLPRLRALVEEWFEILEEDDKVETAAPETFGYMSHHFVCRLRQEHTGPRYDRIKDIRFELQCRTILQDAWANVSHYLAYKGESSVPDELRRDFHALSGLFYVADRHFQLFFGATKRSDESAVKEVDNSSTSDLPLDRPRLQALLHKLYPERKRSDAAAISEMVEELTQSGYVTVGQVQDLLESSRVAFEAYEADNPPGSLGDKTRNRKFADVGVARVSLAIVNTSYAEEKRGLRASRYAAYRHLLSGGGES